MAIASPLFSKSIASNTTKKIDICYQRWSPRGRPWPRGHILKSLALASKPQVLENCPVLGSRTALFFEWLKFCRSAEKCFSRPKKIFKTFFLWKILAFVSLVLGLGFAHFCPWPWLRIFFVSLALASSLVSSTTPLSVIASDNSIKNLQFLLLCWFLIFRQSRFKKLKIF